MSRFFTNPRGMRLPLRQYHKSGYLAICFECFTIGRKNKRWKSKNIDGKEIDYCPKCAGAL